jgi:hypothetical protein
MTVTRLRAAWTGIYCSHGEINVICFINYQIYSTQTLRGDIQGAAKNLLDRMVTTAKPSGLVCCLKLLGKISDVLLIILPPSEI